MTLTPEEIRARVGHLRGLARKLPSQVNSDDCAFMALADLVEEFCIGVSKLDGHDPIYVITNLESFKQLAKVCPK